MWNKNNKIINIVFWFAIIIISVLYIIEAIRCNTILEDEAYTLALIKHDFFDIVKITIADTQPPLSYFYLKICTFLFNYNIVAAKIFALIPILFVLVFGGLWVIKKINSLTALFFIIIFFITPPLLQYAVIVRMYSLALSFVFFAGLFAYEAFATNKNKNWILFSVFALTAAYTHYYGLLSVIVIGLILLLFIIKNNNKLLKKFIICIFCCIILYIPWLLYFLAQINKKFNNGFTIPELTINSYILFLENFCGTSFLPYCFIVLCVYIFIFFILLKSKNKKNKTIAFCAITIPLLTLAIASLISICIKPFLVFRYLIPSLSFFPIFISIGLNEIISKNKIMHKICVISFLLMLSFGGFYTYYNTIKNKNENNIPLLYKDQVDTFYIYKRPSVAWLTSYYAPDRNIVINFTDYNLFSKEANPFENLIYEENIPQSNEKNIILLINKDDGIPEEYYKKYNLQYIGTWNCEYTINAYMLMSN